MIFGSAPVQSKSTPFKPQRYAVCSDPSGGQFPVTGMDIRALILAPTAEIPADSAPISPLPLALLETAGKSALRRTVERLRGFGAQSITVLGESNSPAGTGIFEHRIFEPGAKCIHAPRAGFWAAAEAALEDMSQGGAEIILFINLGGYAEIDFGSLIQFHLEQQALISQANWRGQPLQVFCATASRVDHVASLLRRELVNRQDGNPHFDHPYLEPAYFEHQGYFNPLQDARDLRQFAIDILCSRTETAPGGMQIRPGVWMEPGARVEKGARIVAPAFVGASAKIRARAVITRCSSIEHHAQVDLATVVENSTVLPHCRIGAGLDVAHSLVGPGMYANLRRNAMIEMPDPQLISYVPANPARRLLHTAFELTAYVVAQGQRIFGRREPQPESLREALRETLPSPGEAAGYAAQARNVEAADEFSSSLVGARRYGEQ